MNRFSIALFLVFLTTAVFAEADWEALVDEKGAVSMVHVPGRAEWIELVNEPDGSFHTYVFREIARTPWYIITEDASRSLLFWIPRRSPVRILFIQESGQPVPWGNTFHLEARDWPLLPRDPVELSTSRPSVWKNAGVDIGKDYADHPEPEDKSITA